MTAPDVRAQVAKLRASGASIFVIFTTPKFAIQSYAIANALRWSPAVIYTTSVSATDTFLTLAKNSVAATCRTRRTRCSTPDPANPSWDNDAAMKSYKQVMAKYLPSARVTDGLNLYGFATAEAFVQLLYSAGKNPTRASLMKAYRSWNQPNQFLLSGNRQKTGGADQLPLQCERIMKFTDGTFQPVSKLKCDSRKAT